MDPSTLSVPLAPSTPPPLSDSDEKLKRWSSFIGIVVAICGNILISLALNIQKYAHIRLERESAKRQRIWKRRRRWLSSRSTSSELVTDLTDGSSSADSSPGPSTPPTETSALLPQDDPEKDAPPIDQQYLSSPYWWIGFVLMSIGECGNFLAYGFAPASIVSPLGVVALVSNCVIAPVILKEPLRRRDILGVIISTLGAVTVVWSAEKEETKLGPDQILEAISQTAFEVYFGITCAMIIALMYLSSRYGRSTILIDLGLVALFGGYTVLSTKGISSLLSSSFYHIFAYPIAYLFTAILLLTAVMQIKYVNRALQRFDSTQVIPTQFVLFTISVILGSAILYRDFETVSPERMIKFCVGCGGTFLGVWMISSRRGRREWEDEDEEGVEGSIDLGPAGKRPRIDSLDDRPSQPVIVRGISSSSVAMLDSFPATPNSRTNSYIPGHSPLPPSRRDSVPPSPSRHRKSISGLLPGPIVAGCQLKAFVGDSERREEEEEEEGVLGRRMSESLGVVLGLLRARQEEEV